MDRLIAAVRVTEESIEFLHTVDPGLVCFGELGFLDGRKPLEQRFNLLVVLLLEIHKII